MGSARYGSLYWRIALGFILCVGSVLAVQGVVLMWLLARADPDSRTNFTVRVSADVARALAADPHLDVSTFIRDRYPDPPRSFYAIMVDGRVAYFGDKRPSEGAVRNVLREFRTPGLTAIPVDWEIAPYWASPILLDDLVDGTVAVVPQNLVEQLSAPMALLGLCLLFVGTAIASRFIFGPAHRRLQSLETAALRLGTGDLTVRAAEEGRDEVAGLARAFNTMARDLADRAEQVAASDRARRSLLANVSHELMTPLTAIRGYTEKLAADPVVCDAPAPQRYVSIIDQETLRLERIVRDLLDLARLEGGGDSLAVEDVSVEGLFGRVAARHEADAGDRLVQLTTAIEPGAEIVFGDPFRLEQVFQNLAANALRHTPEGGRVELRAALAGGDVVFAVHNTGPGIPAEHLPFIFNRFYKVDPARAESSGSGLGLSIVKAIVERHGGRVSVESEPGSETVFTIRMPATTGVAVL